jgi:hypothetical protein
MGLYLVANGPAQTTAAFAAVTTGVVIKTLLQVKPFNLARVVEWGISFDGFTAVQPGKVELIETDVAATVTASVDADITKYGPNVADLAAASVAGLSLGTAATGYTASAEGAITAVRNLDAPIFLPPTAPFVKQFPLGREPVIQIAKFGRIRVTFPAAVNCYCYLVLDI